MVDINVHDDNGDNTDHDIFDVRDDDDVGDDDDDDGK